MGHAQTVRKVILATELKSQEKESAVHALELALWECDSCGPWGWGGAGGRCLLVGSPVWGPQLSSHGESAQFSALYSLQPCSLAGSSCQRSTCGAVSQGRDHAASSVDPAHYSSGRFLNELVSYRRDK